MSVPAINHSKRYEDNPRRRTSQEDKKISDFVLVLIFWTQSFGGINCILGKGSNFMCARGASRTSFARHRWGKVLRNLRVFALVYELHARLFCRRRAANPRCIRSSADPRMTFCYMQQFKTEFYHVNHLVIRKCNSQAIKHNYNGKTWLRTMKQLSIYQRN